MASTSATVCLSFLFLVFLLASTAQGQSCAFETVITNGTTNGTIEVPSPYGSGEYDNDLDCRWIIWFPVVGNITLTTNAFQLENNYDFLTIYDGHASNYPLLARWTGNKNEFLPDPISSTGAAVMLRFTTDYAVTRSGFSIDWQLNVHNETYLEDFCNGHGEYIGNAQCICEEGYYGRLCDATDCVDRVVHTGESGMIADHNHADHDLYLPNKFCQWLITPGADTVAIHLQFMAFDVEAYYDYVYVYDGDNTNAPLLAVLSNHAANDDGWWTSPTYASSSYTWSNTWSSYTLSDSYSTSSSYYSYSTTSSWSTWTPPTWSYSSSYSYSYSSTYSYSYYSSSSSSSGYTTTAYPPSPSATASSGSMPTTAASGSGSSTAPTSSPSTTASGYASSSGSSTAPTSSPSTTASGYATSSTTTGSGSSTTAAGNSSTTATGSRRANPWAAAARGDGSNAAGGHAARDDNADNNGDYSRLREAFPSKPTGAGGGGGGRRGGRAGRFARGPMSAEDVKDGASLEAYYSSQRAQAARQRAEAAAAAAGIEITYLDVMWDEDAARDAATASRGTSTSFPQQHHRAFSVFGETDQMLVVFDSDQIINKRGFVATYSSARSCLEHGCGDHGVCDLETNHCLCNDSWHGEGCASQDCHGVTRVRGYGGIIDPSYEDEQDTHCAWVIDYPADTDPDYAVISLELTSAALVPGEVIVISDATGVIGIVDADHEDLPSYFWSFFPPVHVAFSSPGSVTGGGGAELFWAVEVSACSYGCYNAYDFGECVESSEHEPYCKCTPGNYPPTTCANTDCDGLVLLTEPSGLIADHNHADHEDYTNSRNCQWKILPGPNTALINLHIVSFDMEAGYDYLYVYDGPNDSADLLAVVSNGGNFDGGWWSSAYSDDSYSASWSSFWTWAEGNDLGGGGVGSAPAALGDDHGVDFDPEHYRRAVVGGVAEANAEKAAGVAGGRARSHQRPTSQNALDSAARASRSTAAREAAEAAAAAAGIEITYLDRISGPAPSSVSGGARGGDEHDETSAVARFESDNDRVLNIVGNGPSMYLVFETDNIVRAKGFRASYASADSCESTGCGDHGWCNTATGHCDCDEGWHGAVCDSSQCHGVTHTSGASGAIQTNYIPEEDQHCAWVIDAPVDNSDESYGIEIHIQDIVLLPGEVLSVSDADGTVYVLNSETYSDHPDVITSYAPPTMITFTSPATVTGVGGGFAAYWYVADVCVDDCGDHGECVDGECVCDPEYPYMYNDMPCSDGECDGSYEMDGPFAFTDGPGGYIHEHYCSWVLHFSGDYAAYVTFDQISLEEDYDFIYIDDGTGANVATITGRQNPNRVHVTVCTSPIVVTFESDASVAFNGFEGYVDLIDVADATCSDGSGTGAGVIDPGKNEDDDGGSGASVGVVVASLLFAAWLIGLVVCIVCFVSRSNGGATSPMPLESYSDDSEAASVAHEQRSRRSSGSASLTSDGDGGRRRRSASPQRGSGGGESGRKAGVGAVGGVSGSAAAGRPAPRRRGYSSSDFSYSDDEGPPSTPAPAYTERATAPPPVGDESRPGVPASATRTDTASARKSVDIASIRLTSPPAADATRVARRDEASAPAPKLPLTDAPPISGTTSEKPLLD